MDPGGHLGYFLKMELPAVYFHLGFVVHHGPMKS